jgi:CubicO group peptidase (beta-lactamase class C family)
VRAPDFFDQRRILDEDARADDVVECGTGLAERAGEDIDAEPRLIVCAGRRIGVTRHDRSGARHPHVRPGADRAGVANAVFERGTGGDALPFHGASLGAVEALAQVATWPCRHAAVAVVGRVEATGGNLDLGYQWASVTKLAAAVAVLVAAEEGILDLDEPAGPPGSTVRHLMAHASGLPFDEGAPIARPGTRRIYSNSGFRVLARHVEERAEMPFATYYEHVWGQPLPGDAAAGAHGSLRDLLVVAHELLDPQRIARETLDEAVSVQFDGLDGVLPGFGRQTPNDWGLGFELRNAKQPHWTGQLNSPRTFGHFGWSGTFLWVDPEAELGVACLTDLPFGEWAAEAWPALSDAVLAEAGT